MISQFLKNLSYKTYLAKVLGNNAQDLWFMLPSIQWLTLTVISCSKMTIATSFITFRERPRKILIKRMNPRCRLKYRQQIAMNFLYKQVFKEFKSL